MEVSIIVPVYGVESVLHFCIESILNQTYKDFELILVDDGSPDKSGEICDRYAGQDSRIRVIHKQNEGVSVARNTGMDAANGEFIMFCDSDDYYEADYVERMINAQQAYPDYNIWCCFKVVPDYGVIEGHTYNYSNDETISFTDKKKVMELNEKWLLPSPVTKLYKREIIQRYNLKMIKELSRGEDLIFNLDYLNKTYGKIAVLNRAGYIYVRTGEQSLDTGYCANAYEQSHIVINKFEEYFERNGIADDEAIQKLYAYGFYQMYRVLENTMLAPDTSFSEKIKRNNKLLREYDFEKSYRLGKCTINKIYINAIKTKNYYVVYLVDKLIQRINSWRKKWNSEKNMHS